MGTIHIRQTVTRRRVRKSNVGYHTCPRCKGTGKVKNWGRGARKR